MTAASDPAVRRRGPPRVTDFLAHFATGTPRAEALRFDGRSTDYAELNRRVTAVSRALLAAGVRKGDRVATLTTPHPDYFVTFLATASIGAIWLGLNPRYRAEELRQVTGDADPGVLFVRTRIDGRDYSAEVEAIRTAAPNLRHVVSLDAAGGSSGLVGIDAFVASGDGVSDAELAAARDGCGGRDPCLLVYTSGSTGRPKGALLHHEGIVEFSLAQNAAWPVDPQRVLNYFPINHVGCVLDISCPTLVAGGCIVFMEQFEAREALRLMERERITLWASVPSVFQMQLAVSDFASFDLGAVQLIVWEGAAMPRDVIRRLNELGRPMATNYSMTETMGAITIVHPTNDFDALADSVGFPLEGVDVRLAVADGSPAMPGEAGEVQARSILNMLGYWRQPEATAAAFTVDGYFRTGDLAVQRPDGSYRIVGRLKEMYKSGGYNVYPREVEAVIESHPAVEIAAVVSRPDPLWQEVGVAFVLARGTLTATELAQHCRERLANYKLPKEFIICDELPLLPIGKVDKRALARRAAEIPDPS